MQRQLESALREAGDLASATIYRRVAAELAQGLRVAVVASHSGTAARLARELQERFAEIVLIPVEVDPEEGPGLGAEDRLLGVHAALWATPVTAPLGQGEREVLPTLEGLAPRRRAVVLADAHLLERMSDDPAAEAAEVRARLEDLVPDGWDLLDPTELTAWLERCGAQRTDLTEARMGEVGARLVAEALATHARAAQAEAGAIDELQRLLGLEDEALEQERRKGARVAAHLLASMRRHTEELLLDLRAFLDELDADLRPQLEAMSDVDLARRTLPHWLHHVVERWVAERLDAWRIELLGDLRDASVDEEEAHRAELLVPALHAGTMPGDPAWGQRLGVTAAVGGGAAMLALGLWIPGAVAVAGGLAWSAVGRPSRKARTREVLLDAARSALRRMGEDADRLLREQLTQAETQLAAMGEERAASLADQRAAERARLEERLGFHRARAAEIAAVSESLVARIQGLDPSLLPE